MEFRNPTQHRMTRRAAAHDYSRPGIYHITMHVADGLGHPFGHLVGNLEAPDGSADAPRVALSPIGQMVEHELLTTITAHYPMITIQEHVVMPEHIHCLLVVQDRIISQNGKTQSLGQVIAGFKQGCNRRYWQMLAERASEMGQRASEMEQRAKPVPTLTAESTAPFAAPTAASTAAPTASPSASPAAPFAVSPAATAASSTAVPTAASTAVPSAAPTASPSASPTAPFAVSPAATAASSAASSTAVPSAAPTASPSASPAAPFAVPTAPSAVPSTAAPSAVSIVSPSAAVSVSGGFAAEKHPLFAAGYCDVMPIDAAQLVTQRAYITGNPRSRLQRSSHREWLAVHRAAVTTALTLPALRGYLQRECPPHLVTPEALDALFALLIVGGTPTAASSSVLSGGASGGTPTAAASSVLSGGASGGTPTAAASSVLSGGASGGTPTAAAAASVLSGGETAAASSVLSGGAAVSPQCTPRSFVACDTFGDRALLERPLLPVVCHRKDASRFAEQQARCLEAAARGTVLISARIAKGEQAIMDTLLHRGFPVVLITDNGFTDRYHPSAERLDLCADGHLLLITPWQYHYQPEDASISVPTCKAMNCLAQALARQKDTWWQQQ